MITESLEAYPGPPMTGWQVLRWWEVRRLLYNGVVFVIGIGSLFAMEWCFDQYLPAGVDGIEPMAVAMAIVVYGAAANICYTFGWIIEMIGRRTDAGRASVRGEKLFLTGLWLSCLLTTAPLWFGLVGWFVYRKP